MRINKFLAASGLGSRRSVESLITEGRVIVNGEICNKLNTVITENDHVICDGVNLKEKKLDYIAFNKPRGIETTKSKISKKGRRGITFIKDIYDLLPKHLHHLNYAGRLDKDSEGLILLTNDGDFISQIQHPKFSCEKEYEVITNKVISERDISKLKEGFKIDIENTFYYSHGGKKVEANTKFAFMKEIEHLLPKTHLKIILTQGLKRQIRVMLKEVGCEVKNLKRIRIGKYKLDNLKLGKWRKFQKNHVI